MPDEDKSLSRATRIYEVLLGLYPREHRREYGPLMLQHFRDQYRVACRRGNSRLAGFWFRTLADLTRSAFLEQLHQQASQMKTMPPGKRSFILLVVAAGAAFACCPLIPTQPGLALGLAYASVLVLVLRAIVEWKRPANELIRSLIWGSASAVIFALICPMWAERHLPVIHALIVIPVMLGGFPSLIKTGVHLARRSRS